MKKLLKICLVMSVIIIGVVSFKTIDASANAKDVYPLPARIIDVFPSEEFAEDMLVDLNKDSIYDIITQKDIDSIQSIEIGETGTDYLTDADLQLLGNAYFTNLIDIMILPIETSFTTFPDLTTLPKLEGIRAEVADESVSITVPDYQNYPELTSLDLCNRIIIGGVPDFSGIPKLENLNMHNSGLTSEDIPDFTNLKNLKTVDFANNEIRTEMTDFTHLDSLEKMDLSYNYLTMLPPSILGEIYIEAQLGNLPDQTVAFGTDANITLPIYTQLDGIGKISGLQEVRIVNSDKEIIYEDYAVNYDETTQQIILPTSNLEKGEYGCVIAFNGTGEDRILNYSVTVIVE